MNAKEPATTCATVGNYFILRTLTALLRPCLLALGLAFLLFGLKSHSSASIERYLLRAFELLIVFNYFWYFFASKPSFMEAVGLCLVGTGFIYLVSKTAIFAAACIFLLALSWLVMTWIARKWSVKRGVSTLTVLVLILKTALSLHPLVNSHTVIQWFNLGSHVVLILLLFFLVIITSRSWSEGIVRVPSHKRRKATWASLVILLLVTAQFSLSLCLQAAKPLPAITDLKFHFYLGFFSMLLVWVFSWRTRYWFQLDRSLRWLSVLLLVMPVNQLILGLYLSMADVDVWFHALHAANGWYITGLTLFMALCFLSGAPEDVPDSDAT